MYFRSLRQSLKAACVCMLAGTAQAAPVGGFENLEASYRFLVTDRAQGGVLYTATAGKLKGRALPLSFYDTADYWARHVCGYPSRRCAVTDVYNTDDYTLQPLKSPAGDLQTERINIHDGSNIYDAATWQIAVVLGEVANGFASIRKLDAWQLANNQNLLLQLGYSGDAPHFVRGANRAVTTVDRFVYNGIPVSQPEQAFAFRMLGRSWLADDPLAAAPYASLISTQALPPNNSLYKAGRISWTDWKPFTGENAWAFLIGPLQSAYIYHVMGKNRTVVPFDDIAVQNALAVLPTFAAMQSAIGAVYYAPVGTMRNQGERLADPREVATENNASLLAGLRIMRHTLQAQLEHYKLLTRGDVDAIHIALHDINTMINGGRHRNGHNTAGLLAFFKHDAWLNGEFVQGGIANNPGSNRAWEPSLQPKAVDANTWSVAALGAGQIDAWFGFGASYQLWQRLKRWGACGAGTQLQGVGFSDQDGNGIDSNAHYRTGVMSAEWTAGAITMLRNLLAFYHQVQPPSNDFEKSREFVASLEQDERAMLAGMQQLRYERYVATDFSNKPVDYEKLVPQINQPYLYASRRYYVPFGWYANPLPSTCATAWVLMLANRFDPLGYAGKPN